MKIALVVPPFIPVPPVAYGGTELFAAHLAEALSRRGHHVVVYANGESTARCEVRWMFHDSDWPPREPSFAALRNLEHTAWAMSDAASDGADVLHVNDALAVPLTRSFSGPAIHTVHHPHEADLSAIYERSPEVHYVAISAFQRALERMGRMTTIHHGIDDADYPFCAEKEPYYCFLGRVAPVKGVHLAVEVALKAGVPLKIAGEIQPIFRDYWESAVAPRVDGRRIEYVGEADQAMKRELLARSSGLLFPIQWNEPFGLVMIEAMACGTPVLALPGGAVVEVVKDGVSGWVCRDVEEMARRAVEPRVSAATCRAHVERCFGAERMAEAHESLYRRALETGSFAGRRPGAAGLPAACGKVT